MPSRVHAESLLRIPLVRSAFAHPTLAPRPRAVDLRWVYGRILEHASTGFLPLGEDVFYGRISRTAAWLGDPARSARPLNQGDHLVNEVLYAVHDHLHAWALAVSRDLVPDVTVTPRMSHAKREALAFVHLATEAAATVGLDYWYLATREPAEICDVGTLKFPLTTRYHERDLREFRRFRPDLVVQEPAFFEELARFYASGELEGFGARDLDQSPLLNRWLRHELAYGQKQREYVREWLAHLAGVPVEPGALGRALPTGAAWQRKLLRELGDRLWRYVKDGEDPTLGARAARRATPSTEGLAFDPRFRNLRDLSPDEVLSRSRAVTDPAQLGILCDQFVLGFDFAAFDHALLPAVEGALDARDLRALHALFRETPRVPATADEPRALFLLG